MENNGFKNEIMIGTWSWGEGANGSKAVFGQKFTKEHLNEVFDKAYEAGFTAWDTAEVYGMGASERLVGSFISGKDVFISTKHFPNRKYKEGENRKALEASLERLGLSKVDLYWLHSPKEIEKNMKELSQLQKEGLIEHIGLSNGNVEQIKLAEKVLEENGCKLYAIQNHYSLLAMDREKDVLSYCKEKGILFFGYMLLEQ
ncbi:MAG: aldo/keto reductase, partial [Clostridiales bacterium]|nr:aldo/keto reductase [Clostridiales bacterium]